MSRAQIPLLVLLALMAAAFFWPLLLQPGGFLYRPNSDYSDLTITHWPNALFIRRSLATWGQVPLWRPLILGGEPFAANPLSGLWYPPNLLLLVLPLTPAFNLLFLLHALWAGWGGYRLARASGASLAGGLVAALTLMFAPKAVAHLASGHVGLYFAFAWLPWLLWAIRRLGEEAGAGRIATAAATAAMLILADVRLGFYGGLTAAGYWLWGLFCARRTVRWRDGLAGIAAGLLAAAWVAVQIAPLAAVAGRLNRGGLSLAESGIASLPPRYLIGLLVADHGGFQEWMTYLGAVGLLLAVIGLIRWRSRERWGWTALAILAALYSLGTHTPLYRWLYHILPPLGWLRGPARAWFLVVLAAAVLAAHGLTQLKQAGRSRGRRADRLAVALAGVALAGVAGGLLLHLPANVAAAAVIWPLAGTLIALRDGDRLRGSLFSALILALAVVDLWLVGFTLYRVRPAGAVLAEGETAAAWLVGQPGPFRVYSPSYSIPQHTGAVYDVEAVDGVDPFQLADYAAFMQAATGVDQSGYSVTIPTFPEVDADEDMLRAHCNVAPDLELLGLLNVHYLAAACPLQAPGLVAEGQRGGVHLYRNEEALPRAFVVQRVEQVASQEEALAWLAENDPGRTAVVESGAPLDGAQGLRAARLVERTPNRIEAEAEGPGLLVLGEVYDPDWRVETDGEAVEMLRVDGILRGVYLEQGLHRVTFTYWPAGLGAGLGSAAAAAACSAILWAARRRHRRG